MATASIVNTSGAQQGTVELNDAIFNVEPNEALVQQVVVALQAAKRQGTHKTKTRAEVSGGGIKPFRQKGTGRARQGSSREPQMTGGGIVWGPRPHSYRKTVPAKVRRKALCCALTDRLRKERLSIVTGLSCESPKTKVFVQILDKVAAEGRKTLIVTAEKDENLLLSARNIPRASVCTAADLNVLDVLSAVRVVFQEEALTKLEERLS